MKLRYRARLLLGRVHTRTIMVGGVPIKIPPGVLDPRLFRTGEWFAVQVARMVRELPGRPRLLDLGCGTGIVARVAWVGGARVTATDIDPRACRAAQLNEIPDVRQGDLFAPIGDEHFDVICFNPPYFEGQPEGHLGGALYGGPTLEVVKRFAAEVGEHLSDRPGRAWVAWSDRAPPAGPVLGEGWSCVVEEAVEDEVLSVWERVG